MQRSLNKDQGVLEGDPVSAAPAAAVRRTEFKLLQLELKSHTDLKKLISLFQIPLCLSGNLTLGDLRILYPLSVLFPALSPRPRGFMQHQSFQEGRSEPWELQSRPCMLASLF